MMMVSAHFDELESSIPFRLLKERVKRILVV